VRLVVEECAEYSSARPARMRELAGEIADELTRLIQSSIEMSRGSRAYMAAQERDRPRAVLNAELDTRRDLADAMLYARSAVLKTRHLLELALQGVVLTPEAVENEQHARELLDVATVLGIEL